MARTNSPAMAAHEPAYLVYMASRASTICCGSSLNMNWGTEVATPTSSDHIHTRKGCGHTLRLRSAAATGWPMLAAISSRPGRLATVLQAMAVVASVSSAVHVSSASTYTSASLPALASVPSSHGSPMAA